MERRSRSQVLALGWGLLLAIWVLDRVVPLQTALLLFYMLPVFLVSTFAGLGPGLCTALLADGGWFLSDSLWAAPGESTERHLLDALIRLAVFTLLAGLEASREHLLRRERVFSRTDSLTGVDNGRGFRQRAEAEIARADRTGAPFTAAFLDLDDFKACNDRNGHSAGDGILCAVAGVLKASTRPVDAVARIGGDEFALLLPETGKAEAEMVLDRLRADLTFIGERAGWPIGFSLGAVAFTRPPATVDVLLRQADLAMYEAKRGGKGRTVYLEV